MRDVVGFEGLYAVTSCGKVWSYRRKAWLTGWIQNNGYHYVLLSHRGKKYNRRVHILVAEAYLERPDDEKYTDVGHLDDCRTHNWVGNLKWMTRSENLNTEHFREANRNKQYTKVRCVETGQVFRSQHAAAKAVGIKPQGINHVLLGRQKTAGGYHWERVFDEEEKLSLE